MRQRTKARVVARRNSPQAWHLAITLVALIAFAFQSFVTQTHIHNALNGASSALSADIAAKATPQTKPDKFPANQDPSNCPICQEVLHSGSFVTPSAIAALPPALAVSIIAVRIEQAIAPQPVSHSWRGRAPPHI